MMRAWFTVIAAMIPFIGTAQAAGMKTMVVAGMEVPAIPVSILNEKPVRKQAKAAEKKVAGKQASAADSTPVAPAAAHPVAGAASAPMVTKREPAQDRKVSRREQTTTPQRPQPTKRAARTAPKKKARFKEKLVARVTPGVNEVIKISQGHLNRLITPFENPVVETVSKATIKSKAGSLYVTSGDSYPITMFVHEKGEDDPAISLTLIPSFIPPRQIRLVIADREGLYPLAAAGKWEKGHPYIESLKSGMTALAKQEVPHGYGLRRWKRHDPRPECGNRRQGIRVIPKQVIEGHAVVYVVSAVKNISTGTIELAEPLCYERGVLAVAFWPKVVLKPGEKTELYVAYARPKRGVSRQRKSVIE